MANFHVPPSVISICLILKLASSLPTAPSVAATVSSTTGRGGVDTVVATPTGGASGTRATDLPGAAAAAANVASATTAAVPTAANLASTITSTLPAGANPTAAGANLVSAATTALPSGATMAINGANAVLSGAARGTGSATGQIDSAVRGTSGALTTAGALGSGALLYGQNALTSPLGLLTSSNGITTGVRNGISGFVNLLDRGTGQLSTGARSGLTGTGGLIDGGLRVVGFDQPIATPAADTIWQVGEAGRSAGFAILRQGVDGTLYIAQPLAAVQSLGVLGSSNLGGITGGLAAITPPGSASGLGTITAAA